jgi:hypothetical protein
MTTVENEPSNNHNLEGRILTDPETRMTMNFNRETLGFDNKPMEFEDELIKQKE